MAVPVGDTQHFDEKQKKMEELYGEKECGGK